MSGVFVDKVPVKEVVDGEINNSNNVKNENLAGGFK